MIVVAAVAGQRRRMHAAVIAASALPPFGAFAVAVLVVGADHLHEHRMVVAAHLELGLDPVQRILGVVVPVVARPC